MDTSTARELVERLRAALGPAADASPRRRAEYSSDASNYRVIPRAVVFPRSADDVLAAAAVCRELAVPLTARGGGTSIAGNSVGPGVVLDLSRHLNQVVSIDPGARTAVVQPGVVLDRLQQAAGRHGLRFGPDPSTHSRCTVGGMIGNNSCGAHAMAYGTTAANVVALDALDGAGRRLQIAAGHDAVPGLGAFVAERVVPLRHEFGRFRRQVSGYSLEHLLPSRNGSLARALTGTEGTCCIVLGATVSLVPVPAATALCVLGYPDMPAAADAVPGLAGQAVLALEGIDARLVDVVRAHRANAAVPALPAGAAWLFAEVGGASAAEALAAARSLAGAAGAVDSLVVPAGQQAATLWRIREDGAGLGSRTADGAPAWPGWEDAAVPPEHLGPYLREFTALLDGHHLDGLLYGHFGDGCVHIRIDLPLADHPERLRPFLTEAAQLVAGYGGSISGEHGDGRARGELLPIMYSREAIDAFAAFKSLFDPDGLLNPGVIVGARPVDADLRLPAAGRCGPPAGSRSPRTAGTCPGRRTGASGWASAGPTTARPAGSCARRTSPPATRRIPPGAGPGCSRSSRTARWSPAAGGRPRSTRLSTCACRARPALVTAPSRWTWRPTSPRCCTRPTAADCGPGATTRWAGCPGGPGWPPRRPAWPMPRSGRGRWPGSRGSSAGSTRGGRCPSSPAHPGTPSRLRRQLSASAAAGSAAAGSAAAARAAAPAARRSRDQVVIWADTFTRAFSPQVAESAVAVLAEAGFEVIVPDRSLCCGLTWISTGQLGGARARLRAAVAGLAPYAGQGVTVVGLEPSCTAVLRGDLTDLLDGDPRARAVAAATRTLAETLLGAGAGAGAGAGTGADTGTGTGADSIARTGPRDLSWLGGRLAGKRIIAQPHCHHHAVMGYHADLAVLRAAGAHAEALAGCCGLAGNFGMERGHYEVSEAVAEQALLPALRAAPEGTLLLADGFSCRVQASRLTGWPALHLAELLDPRRYSVSCGRPPLA